MCNFIIFKCVSFVIQSRERKKWWCTKRISIHSSTCCQRYTTTMRHFRIQSTHIWIFDLRMDEWKEQLFLLFSSLGIHIFFPSLAFDVDVVYGVSKRLKILKFVQTCILFTTILKVKYLEIYVTKYELVEVPISQNTHISFTCLDYFPFSWLFTTMIEFMLLTRNSTVLNSTKNKNVHRLFGSRKVIVVSKLLS